MPAQDDLTRTVNQLTQSQLEAALLGMTDDLDKAQVLQQKLPGWMINASHGVLEALEDDAQHVEEQRHVVAGHLQSLASLDSFCEEHLKAYCTTQWQLAVQPKKDLFVRAVHTFVTLQLPLEYVRTVSLQSQSLLQVAMQNFCAEEEDARHYPEGSRLQSGSGSQGELALTPQAFAKGCRDLDLGRRYQQHILDVFKLNSDGTDAPGQVNQVAIDIGRMKTLDVRIDAHIARLRGDISEQTYTLLCTLLEQNLPLAQVRSVLFHGRPVIWQGLKAHDCCLWGIVVLAGRPLSGHGGEPCVVYMPGEPVRPLYEYPSLNDFMTYLSLKLSIASYRQFFMRYLAQPDRLDFFTAFDQHHNLGVLQAMTITVSLAHYFFQTYVGKLQLDARTLAVPVADVDEDAREQRLLAYLDAGLTLLNLAGFVVPALGLLMTGVAIGQLLGEVYEGIEDWRRGSQDEALKQLGAVAQSITSMALFAVGGRVVGPLLKRARLTIKDFFQEMQAVRSSDGSLRLWRPDIAHYAHDQGLLDDQVADAQGFYRVDGHVYVKVAGFVHRVAYDSRMGCWRAIHPQRQGAYRPPLHHNGEGAWRFAFEQPQTWLDHHYLFSRLEPANLHPRLNHRCLLQIADIIDKPYSWGYHLAEECLPFPARFRDLYERFRLDQSIRDLIWLLERGVYLNADSAPLQLHALPLLPGWPKGRFFEQLDSQGNVRARYPEPGPLFDANLRVTIDPQALDQGLVFDRVIAALNPGQLRELLGEEVAGGQEQTVLAQRLLEHLKADRRPLFERLYQAYDAPVPQEWLLLREAYPQLPGTFMHELMAKASSVERECLRDQRRIPMALAESVHQMLAQLRLDRALQGFELPELAGLDTHCIAVRLLPRVDGWDRALHIELRQDRAAGDLLAVGAVEGATQRRVVVRSAVGFEPGEGGGGICSGPDGLFEVIEQLLSDRQRAALDLPLPVGENAWRLRYKVAACARGEREQAGEAFSEQAHRPLRLDTPCVIADSPTGPFTQPVALVRKVKKLFPLFTDEQASEMLLDLGVDDLARAKAVKRLKAELAQLRVLLNHWKNDLRDLEQQPGLRDIRHSREQVAQRIEACWRRQSFLVDEWQVSVAGMSLDGLRVGSLPTLPPELRFDHVRQLSLRNMRLGDDVAYFLKCFKGLRRLELDRNQVTRLPEMLSRMPELDTLSMSNNRLVLTEYTRLKLANISTLRSLDLCHNPLQVSVDVSAMRDLHTLLLQDTRLLDLPMGLERLAYLDQVDLRNNWITVIPTWLFQATRTFSQAINLGGNPLADETIEALGRYRDEVGIGMGYVDDDQSRFTELKARASWLPDEMAAGHASRRGVWANLRDDPDSGPLFVLLAQLSGTADSRYVREDLTRRVWEVLQATHDSVQLREQVYQLAAHPLNCADGVAEIFSQIEVQVQVEQATRQAGRGLSSPGALLKLGRGLFRLSELEKIAATYSSQNAAEDPLEVSLAYRTGLAEVLALPGQPRHTYYVALANVSENSLEVAHQQVQTAELSPAFLRFIAQLTFWRRYLKQQFPNAFGSATEPFDVQQQALFENSQNLPNGDYLMQMEALRSPRARAINQVVERLTVQMIKHEDLGICHVPER